MEHNTNCDPEQDSDSAIIEAFCSGAAAAPLPPPPPPGSTSSGPCQQGAGCTVVCAAKLMPLLSGPCAPLLRRLYDGVDGTYDGRAAVFDPITHQCQAMPTTTVIKGLAQLQESGECASHGISLNGLAEQSVGPVPPPPPPCTETMGSAMCSRAISSGVFSCAIDYCEACSGKGQCDTTCAFCTAAPPSPPAPPDTNCDIDSFQARSRRVTADCCDEPGHACVDGIASACDAKCATSYVEFFEQCQSAIGAFLPGRLHAFEALYATCTSLSAQVLLDTAVLCVPMGACNATGGDGSRSGGGPPAFAPLPPSKPKADTRPGWRTTTVYHVNPAVYGDTLAVSPYVFLSIAAYGRVCVDVVVGVTSFFRELTALPLPRSETRT